MIQREARTLFPPPLPPPLSIALSNARRLTKMRPGASQRTEKCIGAITGRDLMERID